MVVSDPVRLCLFLVLLSLSLFRGRRIFERPECYTQIILGIFIMRVGPQTVFIRFDSIGPMSLLEKSVSPIVVARAS